MSNASETKLSEDENICPLVLARARLQLMTQ